MFPEGESGLTLAPLTIEVMPKRQSNAPEPAYTVNSHATKSQFQVVRSDTGAVLNGEALTAPA